MNSVTDDGKDCNSSQISTSRAPLLILQERGDRQNASEEEECIHS